MDIAIHGTDVYVLDSGDKDEDFAVDSGERKTIKVWKMGKNTANGTTATETAEWKLPDNERYANDPTYRAKRKQKKSRTL